jgi:ketosteroid isomerase-like protein
MSTKEVTTPAIDVVRRLEHATNAHDLDALVDCFAEAYVNETPVHPPRGFVGREQVRLNWTQIFDAVPDLQTTLLSSASDGDTVWTEWEMAGVRRDGASHLMRGVIIFGVSDGRVSTARFYLEPVEADSGDVEAAVRAHLGGTS